MVDERAVRALRAEIERVLALGRSLDPTAWSAPSMCEGWSVSDVFAHLACDFERFGEWLDESRAGDLDPPYPPSSFAADNAARLERFAGVPGPDRLREFEALSSAWIARIAASSDDEPQRHPRGTISVGRQVLWATGECAIHGWDVAEALGITWPPPPDVVMLAAVWPVPVEPSDDPWRSLLMATGRLP